MDSLSDNKVTEITINARRLALPCKKNKKASGVVHNLKKFIAKQWKTSDPVYISEDLNKKIWSRGNFGAIGRIRVRVEKGNCLSNPEQKCLKVSLVEVSSFKNLKDAVVTADE